MADLIIDVCRNRSGLIRVAFCALMQEQKILLERSLGLPLEEGSFKGELCWRGRKLDVSDDELAEITSLFPLAHLNDQNKDNPTFPLKLNDEHQISKSVSPAEQFHLDILRSEPVSMEQGFLAGLLEGPTTLTKNQNDKVFVRKAKGLTTPRRCRDCEEESLNFYEKSARCFECHGLHQKKTANEKGAASASTDTDAVFLGDKAKKITEHRKCDVCGYEGLNFYIGSRICYDCHSKRCKARYEARKENASKSASAGRQTRLRQDEKQIILTEDDFREFMQAFQEQKEKFRTSVMTIGSFIRYLLTRRNVADALDDVLTEEKRRGDYLEEELTRSRGITTEERSELEDQEES